MGLGRGKVRKKKERRSRWRWRWTDGRGLEVDGGQLAAGGLRELCQHAGQGPVLCLQPLLNLPQGLNLLYLGEVLQGGENNNHNTGKQKEREREEAERTEGQSERPAEEEKKQIRKEKV